MAQMMPHPHTRAAAVPRPIGPMVYRLRQQSPNCGYAEVEIVSHPNSHHRPGDVVLISWDDYERGTFVKPPDRPEPPPKSKPEEKALSQAVTDFLAINPHIHDMAASIPPKRSKTNDTRRKSKAKNKRPLKKL